MLDGCYLDGGVEMHIADGLARNEGVGEMGHCRCKHRRKLGHDSISKGCQRLLLQKMHKGRQELEEPRD